MDETLPPSSDHAPANLHTGRSNGHENLPDDLLVTTPAVAAAVPVPRPHAARARRPWPGWERLSRFLLAFVIASLLWFYVLNLQNPAGSATYTLIPVTARGLTQNLSLGNDLGTVTVTAQAPQDVLARLNSSQFSPTVDLSGRGPGTYLLPVQVAAPGNVQGVVAEPSQIQVQVIEVSQQTFPIQARVVGVPAFSYQVETQQVRPTSVQVRGPRDLVARIDHVVAEVDVGNRQGTQQGDVQPRALDFAGHDIPGLQFNPPSVTVVIAIQQLLNYKTLPVHVPVEGAPAPGYGVTDIVVQPTTLTAYGSPSLLEPLTFLETAPVSIAGATQTVNVTVAVSLTKSLSLYPPNTPNSVQVRVQIAELTTKTQLSVPVHRTGLVPGLVAIASPDRVDVTLSGPFDALQGLKPDTIEAVLDLTGYGVGTYRLAPTINLPPGMTALDTAPSTVTVTVSVAPTATPEPTPVAPAIPTGGLPPPSPAAGSPPLPALPSAVPATALPPEPTATPASLLPVASVTPTPAPVPK